jgi:hypothetical protein
MRTGRLRHAGQCRAYVVEGSELLRCIQSSHAGRMRFEIRRAASNKLSAPVEPTRSELAVSVPKSIGVGQYQHDVDEKKLMQGLEATVESCVNRVGVDLNTASWALLR